MLFLLLQLWAQAAYKVRSLLIKSDGESNTDVVKLQREERKSHPNWNSHSNSMKCSSQYNVLQMIETKAVQQVSDVPHEESVGDDDVINWLYGKKKVSCFITSEQIM